MDVRHNQADAIRGTVMEHARRASGAGRTMTGPLHTDAVSVAQAALQEGARTFAEARGLAFKSVLMSDGPEPRIGLGFYPSGRLRDVAVRLFCRSASGVCAISRLPVAQASAWGEARPMVLYRMRSEVELPWPMAPRRFEAFLDCAVEQARRSTR